MAALHRLLCGRGAALPARPGPAVGVRAARGRACAVERGTVRTWCAAEAAGGAALRGRVSWCGEPGEWVLPSRQPLGSERDLNLARCRARGGRAGRYRPLPRSLPQRGVTSSALKIAPARAALGGRSGFGGAKGKALLEGFHVSFRYTRSCVAGWLGILEPCLPEGVGLAHFALSLRARLSCVSCSLSRRWAALSRVLHFWALR